MRAVALLSTYFAFSKCNVAYATLKQFWCRLDVPLRLQRSHAIFRALSSLLWSWVMEFAHWKWSSLAVLRSAISVSTRWSNRVSYARVKNLVCWVSVWGILYRDPSILVVFVVGAMFCVWRTLAYSTVSYFPFLSCSERIRVDVNRWCGSGEW